MNSIHEWLNVIDRYYLSDFIISGGSAFKLVLTQGDDEPACALEALRDIALQRGYGYVGISAAETRIDRIDQLFFAITRQMDWDSLTAEDAITYLRTHNYNLPAGVSLSDTSVIAEANGCTQDDFVKELRRVTAQEIIRDRRMCKDFRTAIAQLRKSQFFPRSVTPTDTETLIGWLRGDKVSMNALRGLGIYSKIGRNNARDMLRGLTHWMAKSFIKGIVIGIDLSALLCDKIPAGQGDTPSLRYSRSALLDTYEVLREFIDETDEIDHCLICAAAPVELETDAKKSIFSYYALQNRLVNEVHDRDRQNLLAAMVRVGDDRELVEVQHE